VGDVLTVDDDPSCGRRVDPTDQVEEGGLSRAGGPEDHDELTAVKDEIGVVQGCDIHFAHVVGLHHVLEYDE